jgi:hypothetical protein
MEMGDFSSRQQVSPAVRRRAQRLFRAACGGEGVPPADHERLPQDRRGPFWRILSKDGCRQWWLMDHETYNREIRR